MINARAKTDKVDARGLARYGNQVPPYTNTRKYLRMVLDRYYEYKAAAERGHP